MAGLKPVACLQSPITTPGLGIPPATQFNRSLLQADAGRVTLTFRPALL